MTLSQQSLLEEPSLDPVFELDQAVKDQYETFPYPPRDPLDERHRLLRTMLESVPCINHFVFCGAMDITRAFRILIAGGGTGDSLIYIAQQFKNLGRAAEITYIDVSDASRKIAEARAQVRGLDNIRFITGSLLDVGSLAPGKFDYINCSGVLHHLNDPLAGLRALSASLNASGGIGLMFYAELGRTGVYPLQDILKIIAPSTLSSIERIRIARKLIANLPEWNLINRNPVINDHHLGDADLFDLLLHSRDQAYSVESISQLVNMAGLRIASFMPPGMFEASTYLKDAEILARISDLSLLQRAAFAEKLAGCINKLVFYAVASNNPVSEPNPLDLQLIPLLSDFPPIPTTEAPLTEVSFKGPYFDGKGRFTPNMTRILRGIDGRRTLDEIRVELGIDIATFNREFSAVYPFLRDFAYIQLSRTSWVG